MIKQDVRSDADFKRDAVALSHEPVKSPALVERSLGISAGLGTKWRRQLSKKGTLAFPGNGVEAFTT